jgi:predicted neuraminidase/peroxiredoxin
MKRLSLFVFASSLVWSCGLFAQSSLKTGDSAGVVSLTSPEGFPVSMNNYAERRGTVVLFLSTRDQGTSAAATQIVALNQQFRHHKILITGIFSNPAQPGFEVRAFCQANGFNFPVYLDPQRKVARRFGAQVTPEAFLLDKEGKLVYSGSIQSLSAVLRALDSGSRLPISEANVAGTPIGSFLPKRTIQDPYGEIEFSSELIFNKIPGYPVHHCSSIILAPNGDLLVTWYGGSYESSDDQVLFMSRRKKGTRTWSKPEIIVRSPGKPPGNALLFMTGDNRVWLVWGRMEGTQPMLRGTGWNHCSLFYRTSSNSGVTWTQDKPFFHDTYGWLPRNLSITLSDGTLILPLSDELHGFGPNGQGADLSFFLATKDNGATWTRSGIMRGGEQPTFIQRADGSLLAYLRVRPNIVASESHDGGKTWTPPVPTQWKNPDSGISMRRLHNGHVLLVFNNQDNSRSPLHIARSLDDGRTWSKPLELESNPGEYSYPSIFQTPDSKIHIIYTFRRYSIKHIEMNEDWFTRLQRPD